MMIHLAPIARVDLRAREPLAEWLAGRDMNAAKRAILDELEKLGRDCSKAEWKRLTGELALLVPSIRILDRGRRGRKVESEPGHDDMGEGSWP